MKGDIPHGVTGQVDRGRHIEFPGVIDKIGHHPAQSLRRDPHPGGLFGTKLDRPADIGIIADDSVENVSRFSRCRASSSGCEVRAKGDVPPAPDGSYCRDPAVAYRAVPAGWPSPPAASSGLSGLADRGDGGKDPRSLPQMIVDARLHRVKRAGGATHLSGPCSAIVPCRAVGWLQALPRG